MSVTGFYSVVRILEIFSGLIHNKVQGFLSGLVLEFILSVGDSCESVPIHFLYSLKGTKFLRQLFLVFHYCSFSMLFPRLLQSHFQVALFDTQHSSKTQHPSDASATLMSLFLFFSLVMVASREAEMSSCTSI